MHRAKHGVRAGIRRSLLPFSRRPIPRRGAREDTDAFVYASFPIFSSYGVRRGGEVAGRASEKKHVEFYVNRSLSVDRCEKLNKKPLSKSLSSE